MYKTIHFRKVLPWLIVLAAILVVIAGYLIGRTVYYKLNFPCKYSEYVEQYSKEYDVDDALVYAVIKNESGFDEEAVSRVGARGLMQITSDTFDWAKFRMTEEDNAIYDDLFYPQVNIKYGTFILSLLLQEFGTPEVALAAYHAGWGNVKEWLSDEALSSDGYNLDNIPFDTTDWYVKKIIKDREVYRQILSETES